MRVAAARLIAAERLEGTDEAAPLVDVLQQIFDPHARQAGGNGGAQLAQHGRDQQRVALLELEPAIADGGEAVAGQAALCGARRAVEFLAEPGQEDLPVGRQVEAPVGLLAGLLPAPVIVDQVPKRDVVAAVRQEQAARPERVADRKGERDLPDGAVERAVADEIGPPVRLDEAMRVVGYERAAAAGIQRTQAFDGPEQGLAAGGGLERQGEKGRQVLPQRAVAREHGVEMAARFQPLVGPAGDRRLDQRRRVLPIAERGDALRAVGRHQRIDGAEHAVQAVACAAAQALAPFLDRRARPAVHAGQEQVVHLDDLVEQRLAGLDEVAGDERVALWLGKAPEVAGIVAAPELAELADDPRVEVAEVRAGAEQVLDQPQAGQCRP